MLGRDVQMRTGTEATAGRAARRVYILDRLREAGSIMVGDVATNLSTSEMTIRRDLNVLEADGLVRRIHGGAVLVTNRAYEPTFREKSVQFVDEKRRIGVAAAALVEPGDTIILSPGTTTLEVAHNLAGRPNLTVVTSAINIATDLAGDPDIDVIVTEIGRAHV